MPHVLVIHESETVRGDLQRALSGEGFTVAEADSSSAAVREVWSGNFDGALIGTALPKVGGVTLEEHIKNLAPEIVTLPIGKEPPARLARKLAELLEGSGLAA
jgi:CheY-like chemotaxis protein